MAYKKKTQEEAQRKTIEECGSRGISLIGKYNGIYYKTIFYQDGYGEFETTPHIVWHHHTNHPLKGLKSRGLKSTQEEAVNKTNKTRGVDGISLIGEYHGCNHRTLFHQKGYGDFLAVPKSVWAAHSNHPLKTKQVWSDGQKGDKNHTWNPDRKAVAENRRVRVLSKNLVRNTLSRTGNKKNDSSERLVGYSARDLKNHISTQFEPWMTWDNSGFKDGNWHVDHFIPVKAFVSAGITDLKIINFLGNLSPMDCKINMTKGSKWEGPELKKFFSNGMDIKEIEEAYNSLFKLITGGNNDKIRSWRCYSSNRRR
jgi:hypothetical protein